MIRRGAFDTKNMFYIGYYELVYSKNVQINLEILINTRYKLVSKMNNCIRFDYLQLTYYGI